jgi:hypothetical protein
VAPRTVALHQTDTISMLQMAPPCLKSQLSVRSPKRIIDHHFESAAIRLP